MTPKERAAYASVAILFLIILGVVGYKYSTRKPEGSESTYSSSRSGGSSRKKSGPTQASVPSEIQVDVEGAVRTPGVYKFAPGSRIQDAIQEAGGVTADANLEEISQAELLTDGELLRIPKQGEPTPEKTKKTGKKSSKRGAKKAALTGTISLNSATLEQLEELPGVGPATAQKILTYRSTHGNFSSIGELRDVGGIGPKKYDQIAPHVHL